MTTHVAQQVSQAYQQTPLWTLDMPDDSAAGIASTALAPLMAEISRHTGPTAPRAAKQAAFSQVVAELRRTAQQVGQSKKYGHGERIAFGGFVQVLLQHYERQLHAL